MVSIDNLNFNNNINLVNIPNTEAKAYFLSDRKIFVEPEVLCNIGCELPRINYENYLGKSSITDILTLLTNMSAWFGKKLFVYNM